MSLVLAIDLGTSGCRSAVFDESLQMLCVSRAAYDLEVISETWIEQDAQLWWSRVKETLREAALLAGSRREEIKGISISSQGITPVLTDEAGRALARAISWMDLRAVREGQLLEERFTRREIYRLTGKRCTPAYTLPKLMWIRTNRPEEFARTKQVLLPMDFILRQLCGESVTDHTMASGTMAYNILTQSWEPRLLSQSGFRTDQLARLSWAGEKAGVLLPELVRELGLDGDVCVSVGAQDQKCAAYGAGICRDVVTVSLGTASSISALREKPLDDPKCRIPQFSYLEPESRILEGLISTAASALEWFRKNFCGGISYQELNRRIAAVKTGGIRFYPYLSGSASPLWREEAGTFSGLTLDADAAKCARAIMEGIAFHIRANLEVMEEGSSFRQIRIFGGGAASDVWCQMIADVAGREVLRLSNQETALIGAARLAYRGLGILLEAPSAGTHFDPRETARREYEDAYHRYWEEIA